MSLPLSVRASFSRPKSHGSALLIACLAMTFVADVFSTTAACQDSTADPSNPLLVSDLRTRWYDSASDGNGYTSYPRPRLQREQWQNLNGHWDYAITPIDSQRPKNFDGTILVPYPVQSQLSQVRRGVSAEEKLWYRRNFEIQDDWHGDKLLLHFGAVDWKCEVWVNGFYIGEHQGGYTPFAFDITDATTGLNPGPHELVVAVTDPTDSGPQPRGKQVSKPEGIWYTPVTGIWQTVWLEPVSSVMIEEIEITTNAFLDGIVLRVSANHSDEQTTFKARIVGTDVSIEGPLNQAQLVTIPNPRLWSPDDPHLYDVEVELWQDGHRRDSVVSYFGLRTIETKQDENGINRFFLNGTPLFMFGPLDQGWWPDGLYAAPTEEALFYDIEIAQAAGFNMIRKHVKVEPAIWYEKCDRLGMLVWQDMPSGDTNAPWPLDGTELVRSEESSEIYGHELRRMMLSFRHHPSIVAWIPFNEAWGQSATRHWTTEVLKLDQTRIVISASGGNDFGVGHAHDIHNYPGPEAPPAEENRAAVLGEYGGLGLPIAGHTWQSEANWGYRSFDNKEKLQEAYLTFIDELVPLVESRLAAAVYTQTSDVEIEVNGLMTYDRAEIKFDLEQLRQAHQRLYAARRSLTAAEKSFAATLAYWRFEEGEPGTSVPSDRSQRDCIAARDESTHDNHLYAFDRLNAPLHSNDVPAAVIPLTGAVNRGSLNDSLFVEGVTRDLYTDPGRSQTHMDVINTFPLTEWTIEFSVKPAAQDFGGGTLIGEDGHPIAELDEAPMQIMLTENGYLQMTIIDRGEVRSLRSKEPLELDRWHHVVLRSSANRWSMSRVVEGKLVIEADDDGIVDWVLHPGTWTIGRGFHANRISRDARAQLDEIRISTRALPDDQLLWTHP